MKTHFLKTSSLVITASFMLFVSLSSCKKDQEPGPGNVAEVKPACKIAKSYTESNPDFYWLNQYDQQDHLLVQTFYNQGAEFLIVSYKRNANGQIVEQMTVAKPLPGSTGQNDTTIRTYEYNNTGQVVKFTGDSREGRCEYDAQGNRIRVTEIDLNTGEEKMWTYEYMNGNCIKRVDLSPDSERIYEYEYYLDQENKLAPLERLNSNLTGQTPNRNMRKKTTITENGLSGTTSRSIQYTHEYNDKGFATKTTNTNTSASGTISMSASIIEYSCQ